MGHKEGLHDLEIGKGMIYLILVFWALSIAGAYLFGYDAAIRRLQARQRARVLHMGPMCEGGSRDQEPPERDTSDPDWWKKG
jgi:hypothetical protein